MRLNLTYLRGLLNDGEVPRWIGLSLVSLLLCGLAAASYSTALDTRTEMAKEVRSTADRSVDLLAWMLSQTPADDAQRRQHILRKFNQRIHCEQLRIVDARKRVVASINVDEIGTAYSPPQGLADVPPSRRGTYELQSNSSGLDRRLVVVPFRVPVPSQPSKRPGTAGNAELGKEQDETATPNREQPQQADQLVPRNKPHSDIENSKNITPASHTDTVHCVLITASPPILSTARVRTGAIILAVLGLYLLLWRVLRRHYAGMGQISGCLRRSAGQIQDDLQALRIADNSSELAEQWNSFVDVVDDLSVKARRASASTELKEVLVKSRRGELAEVVNAIPDGLLYVVENDRLGYANSTARRLMEMEEGGGEPEKLGELVVGETGSKILEQISQAWGGSGSYNSTSSVVEACDGASSYRIRTFALNPRMGRGIAPGSCVAMITDISQQVRADKASEEFVSQVTHELRTPLTNIRAYAETLSSGVFDDPKVITECYNVITKETRRLSRLIEDMLSMSQLEVGTIQIQLNAVDLQALLSDSVRDLRGIADDKQIDMQLSLPAKLPELLGDRDKLAVVINNLLGNALKYTPDGGSVIMCCKAGGDAVQITVKDTGMGVDKSDHERIFEKFQRGSSPGVDDVTGTGIGLTTAREITRRHGGDIEVMSDLGEGATFIVTLPLKGGQSDRGARSSTMVGSEQS